MIQLINEHNSLSIEMNKLNLHFRRSTAIVFIVTASVKIVTLYLTIYMKHYLVRILAFNAFIWAFIFGFAMSIVFSQQIHLAQNSYKNIHSIVCNYRMRLHLKLQVNLIKFNKIQINIKQNYFSVNQFHGAIDWATYWIVLL